MALPPVDSQSLTVWLADNALPLLVAAVVLFVVYRWARPAIHRVLVRVMHAQQAELAGDPALIEETDRRVATLEDLFAKILRFAVVVALIIVILGVFDLWSVLAGLGLVLAALTLAGQSIVLDYLMGILILTEGQYFNGDVVQLGTVEGTVEEVGLRRTVVRDVKGTVHSVSNGTIRVSSNRTRTYALATVDLDGIAGGDVEGVIEVFDAVGRALSEDEAFAGKLLDVPGYAGTIRLSSAGATLRLSGRTRPDARAEVETEMRRRVAAGLAARGIEPIRPGTYASVDAR
jgi:moderate conductance mechanosensitive channel